MTTNPNAPISIDYTNRDFYSIKEQLISRVKNNVPGWSGQDPADFGVAMVEAFAYIGDIVSYYIDRIANESTLLTATQRQSLINLAGQYGYTPSGYLAAYTTLKFTNSSDVDVTIPEGTQVSGEIAVNDVREQIIFTTLSDVVVPATDYAFETAYHGANVARDKANAADPDDVYDIAGELVGVSDGSPQQQYLLSQNQVVDGTVRVFVRSGTTYQEWVPVEHITDYGPQDSVFHTSLDADNYVTVTFGDGVSGAIPPATSAIKVQYVVGGGVQGNIPSKTLNTLLTVPGLTDAQTSSLAGSITVENTTVGAGGVDPESDLEIRLAAPQTLAANNRAVTLSDYATLALNVTGVGKAKAHADVWSSVTLYVAPSRSQTDGELYPMFDLVADVLTLNTDIWTPLQTDVVASLQNKTQVGVSLTVSPPAYVNAGLEISYTLKPQANDTSVRAAILSAITTAYSYYYSTFGAIITPEEIEAIVRQVGGVYNASVTSLYRLTDTAARLPLVGAPNELFVFAEDSISLTLASSDASLTAIVPSVGTLSPAFNTAVAMYNVIGSFGSTTSLTLTFTQANADSTIYVNGTALASNVFTWSISSGTNTANVSVLAQDGYTSHSYVVTLVK